MSIHEKDDIKGQHGAVELLDNEPTPDDFLEEALAGLRKNQKSLPCKFFYDEIGSALFDRICELDEYYLTRTEIAIMEEFAGEMGRVVGPESLIVEYGSGSATKTRLLLDQLDSPVGCVLVDISREHLLQVASGLAEDYPDIPILPVCANFMEPFGLPEMEKVPARAVAYFPGSTIGNFTPEESVVLLKNIAEVCGKGGGLLIGADLKKDVAVLEAAYDDREGVTAKFNLNLLARMNRELGADFDLDRFRFRSFYNAEAGRVESYLVSQAEQVVRLGGETIRFGKDEAIHTENSCKYSLEEFEDLASAGGFSVERVWTDSDKMFSVQFLAIR